MRILFALHSWHPEGRGGTEVHARAVSEALTLKGHQLGVFTRTGRPHRPEYEVTTEWQGKTSVTRINNNFRETPVFEWVYKNRRVHEAFERELDEFKPDLVHVHHLVGLSTTILETMKLRGVPVVLTLHDFWTVCPRGQRMRRDLTLCESVDRETCFRCLNGLWPHLFQSRERERTVVDQRGQLSPAILAEWDRHMAYVLGLCDLIVCPSEFHRERMLDFPLDPERVIALPHGMDAGAVPATTREPRPVRRIGFIGSVIPVKGVHVLIEAFQQLGRDDLRLDVHGDIPPFHEDRTYGERLREMAAQGGNISFHGGYTTAELPAILEKLDVLVVPSLWWETFCLTIREAQLAGIPVVASDHGALREALDGEQDGLLFRAGDPADLKEKLERLIADDALRARLAARRESVKRLDPYIEELEQVYARAQAIAVERQPSIVVAPPSFPEEAEAKPPVSALLPWERLSLAMRQEGGVAVSLATRMPSSESPKIGLGFALRDAGRHLGNVEVEIDLAAVEQAHRQVATEARLVTQRVEPLPAPAAPPGEAQGTHEVAAAQPSAEGVADAHGVPERKTSRPPDGRFSRRSKEAALEADAQGGGGAPKPRVQRRSVVSASIKTRRWTPPPIPAVEVVELRRPSSP